MKSRTRVVLGAIVVACALAGGARLAVPLALGDPSGPDAGLTQWGTTEVDQTAPTSDESGASADSPPVASYDGGTGFATTTWSSAEVDGPSDINVISSTAPGTWALSGVVVDDSTGVGVPGATVTMTSATRPTCFGCMCPQFGCPVLSQTTQTDSSGGYALADMPMSNSTWTYAVSASGYGRYTETHVTNAPDSTYELTFDLTAAAQSFDELGSPGDNLQNDTTATSTSGKYGSNQRVPPFIRVALYTQSLPSCAASGSGYTLQNIPWAYYTQHVFVGEVNGYDNSTYNMNADSGTAIAEAINSFSWYWRVNSSSSPVGSDVDNTTNFQCYRPDIEVKSNYKPWITTSWSYYIGDSSQKVQAGLHYHAGDHKCTSTTYKADGNDLGQTNAMIRGYSSGGCYQSSWKSIDQYFYTGTVQSALAPPTPSTSFSRPSGAVTLNFTTTVNGADTAWTYELDRQTTSGSWATIKTLSFDSNSGAVPTSYTYRASVCQKYRVQATNPIGSSQWASFNSGGKICPG